MVQLNNQEIIQVIIQVTNQLIYHQQRHIENQVVHPVERQHLFQEKLEVMISDIIQPQTQMLSVNLSKGWLLVFSQAREPYRNNHSQSRFVAVAIYFLKVAQTFST